MPRISVDPDEFANIVFSYLFDKYLNFEEVSNENEDFNDVMRKMKPRLFPISRHIYLEQDGLLRVKYKIIKDAFRDPQSPEYIMIVPRGKSKEEEPGLIQKVIKKVISLVKSSNEFSKEEIDYLTEILEIVDNEEEQING